MNFILTNHAKQRMIERGIGLEEIKDAIYIQDYVIRKYDRFEAHKKINNKNIKVIYSKSNKFIKIITVILR